MSNFWKSQLSTKEIKDLTKLYLRQYTANDPYFYGVGALAKVSGMDWIYSGDPL